MKINVTQPILDYKNEPIKSGEETFMVREAISQAVNSTLKTAPPMTAEDKGLAYQISIKVFASKEANFSIEKEIPFILKKSGEIHSPMTYGRIRDLFDKTEEENQTEEDDGDTQSTG